MACKTKQMFKSWSDWQCTCILIHIFLERKEKVLGKTCSCIHIIMWLMQKRNKSVMLVHSWTFWVAALWSCNCLRLQVISLHNYVIGCYFGNPTLLLFINLELFWFGMAVFGGRSTSTRVRSLSGCRHEQQDLWREFPEACVVCAICCMEQDSPQGPKEKLLK